jgi:8-oxo-dGTP pyrophosphatase MutT (NUDIX family)
MDKFSNLQKNIKKQKKQEENKLYKNDHMEIVEYNDWEFVKGNDVVVILPYFRDESNIILRHEYIPTYQYHYKDNKQYKHITHFLTMLSGTVEPGEDLKTTVRREIYEEAGIVLSNIYEIEFDKHLFLNKGNVSQYHTCILELIYNDYKLTSPKGDGSYSEKVSNSISVSLGDIDDLKTHDLITEYMLTKFKSEYLK